MKKVKTGRPKKRNTAPRDIIVLEAYQRHYLTGIGRDASIALTRCELENYPLVEKISATKIKTILAGMMPEKNSPFWVRKSGKCHSVVFLAKRSSGTYTPEEVETIRDAFPESEVTTATPKTTIAFSLGKRPSARGRGKQISRKRTKRSI